MHTSEGVFFSLGDIFSLSRSCSVCSVLMIPSRAVKKPVRTSVHSARPRAMIPYLSPAELPAGTSAPPHVWNSDEYCLLPCTSVLVCFQCWAGGLYDSLIPSGAYGIRRTSYHYKKHCWPLSLQLHEKVFPHKLIFLVWMRLEMMGTGGSGYPDIFFPCSDSDNTSQLWGKEGWFFCFYTEDWKLWFNPWTVYIKS